MLRILVTGSRDWTDRAVIERELRRYVGANGAENVMLIEGECRGADVIARNVAYELGLLPHHIMRCYANWDDGKAAGPRRNQYMLTYRPDIVLAFNDDLPRSKGTADMVLRAVAAGVPVKVITSNGEVDE